MPPLARVLAPEALAARLIDALGDANAEVRLYSASALADLGLSAVEPLASALTDANPGRRAFAAYALGMMRPAPRRAVPALTDLLRDPDSDVRAKAAQAVSRILARDRRPSPDILPPAPKITPGG